MNIYYSTARAPELKTIESLRTGAWIHVEAPNAEELQRLSEDFNLDIDLLNDAVDPYEAPRIEQEDDTVYVFTRYCYPENGVNATEPLLIIYRDDCLITIVRAQTNILKRLQNGQRPVITTQKTKTLLQIIEEVNETYTRYLNVTTRQVLRARTQLRGKNISNEQLLQFVDLEDDLNEMLSALQPQASMLRNLLNGKFIRLYEQDKDLIEDLSLGTAELIELAKSRVKTIVNIRQAYDAIATNELNKTFRRLTSISIFLMIPTIVSGIFGMNVPLPLQEHPYAFWFVIAFIVLACASTVLVFRRKRWL
ncbi:MAG: mg2 transporter protein CorA family protein magnesium transporter [Candidatus Saccharibacteria bacterium]|nr:mg2 transporter protein CorA family protein magnesium transporter [Candidatus Saccharibacteria bacterium]